MIEIKKGITYITTKKLDTYKIEYNDKKDIYELYKKNIKGFYNFKKYINKQDIDKEIKVLDKK